MKIFIAVFGILIVIVASIVLNNWSLQKETYDGLSTVGCLDDTKPIVEEFSLTIKININGKNYPLDKTIGHDFGNCLHKIFVNDSSGKVFVKSDSKEIFTLGQFFDVWRKTFSKNQIFGFQKDGTHSIRVYVNGLPDYSYREIILSPNKIIEVSY